MPINIIRYSLNQEIFWGKIVDKTIFPLGSYLSLADFLEKGLKKAQNLETSQTNTLTLDNVELISPITSPCNIVCQGRNYREHIIETGNDPDEKTFNLFFTKACSSLTSAKGKVVRPKNVQLLDYELELGLVIGKNITKAEKITNDNLSDFVVGIFIANDVSARDIQLSQGQWFKGKSFRTFCPTGPYITLLDKEDFLMLYDLELKLWVNDELRQNASTKQLIYPPPETLTELSEIMDLSVGDIVLTGTPGGVALQAPSKFMQKLSSIVLSEQERMKLFISKQLENPRYLKNGDKIRATIKSNDGKIDLGEQELLVTE
jgi:2-keto-4-pentenoate hydratase/2-oxohepta-3-ene-1,7-dioic acid hydratase in catechol pathway